MSRYFQTLKRLRSGEQGAAAAREPVADLEGPAPTPDPYPFSRVTLRSAQVQAEFSELLGSLRLAALSSPSRSVVVAAVSHTQASRRVMEGLEVIGDQGPLEVVRGELEVSAGGRSVRLRRTSAGQGGRIDAAAETAPAERILALDLNEVSLAEKLRNQIGLVNPKADLAVVHGPPLTRSVEAALRAGATAGIVLVVELMITPRSDLFVALDRIERSGSTILGVVTVGKTVLPRWLQRSLSAT